MRILFVSHYALPHLGGIEVAVDALANELVGRGHEVVHLASSTTPPFGAPPERRYDVIAVPALNVLEERLGVPWPIFAPQLIGRLRRAVARANVIHAHGFLYASSVLSLVMAARAGRARVLTEHVGHVTYERAVLDRLEAAAIERVGRLAVRSAQAVVVVNEKVGAQVLALDPGAVVHRIPNGVDTATYRPPRPGEREALRAQLGWDERPRALFVGRLVAKKGIDLALGAAACGGGAFELVVIGPGRPPGDVPAGVRLLGAQPPARVAELYRAADVLLLPSRGEGFPITVQEAMASELPAVLAEDDVYAPYVAGSGVRLTAGDPAALAAAVADLTADPDARRAAGRAAGEHARAAFSWPRAADRHEALYESLLAAAARGAGPTASDAEGAVGERP